MFANFIYWAFDQVDNAAGILAHELARILSSQDAVYQMMARIFFIQFALAAGLLLALSL